MRTGDEVDESNVFEVVDRIVFLCVAKVPGMVKKAKHKASYVLLLQDSRVDMNHRGTLMELIEWLYGQERDFLLSMSGLDRLQVYRAATRTAHAKVDDIENHVCKDKSYTSENPIVLCDGDHGKSDCGYHIGCLCPPLEYVPEEDWLYVSSVCGGGTSSNHRCDRKKDACQPHVPLPCGMARSS
eukprot:1188480-Prorocentrum_minimum.AAC.3